MQVGWHYFEKNLFGPRNYSKERAIALRRKVAVGKLLLIQCERAVVLEAIHWYKTELSKCCDQQGHGLEKRGCTVQLRCDASCRCLCLKGALTLRSVPTLQNSLRSKYMNGFHVMHERFKVHIKDEIFLEHACVRLHTWKQVCTFHDGCKQGIDQQQNKNYIYTENRHTFNGENNARKNKC